MRFLCIAISLLIASTVHAEPATTPPKPNIVLVTLDTTRSDRLGCYGYALARTPNIDFLATEGVRCTNAVTTAPITLPAHASIMTGLLPPAHGIRDNGAYTLSDEYTTLAEVLKQNGYTTGAFVSAVVLAKRYNLSQGFDVYDDNLYAEDDPKLFMIRDRPAPRTAERAVAWLREQSSTNKPFFLWVHFFDPHQPYESRYANRHLLPTPYDAEIAQADEGVGAILNQLRNDNRLDSSIVAVTADHGESLGEHGEKTHAIFVYDATVRVPLIMRYPGKIVKGSVYKDPVSSIDLFPTILSAAGIPDIPRNQGADLYSAYCGNDAVDEAMQYSESLLSEVGFGMAPLYAVRYNGRKYIRAPKPEFYDLKADAGELNNLYDTHRGEAANLDAALQRMLDFSAKLTRGAPRAALDEESMETLRALGYVATEEQRSSVSGMDPKDGMALYAKLEDARHAAQRRDYAISEELLREILATAPDHITARNVLGLVLTRMGKWDDATREYKASLASDPSQARVLHMLGVLSVRQKKYDDAQKYCERAVELSPNLVESMVILGFIAQQKNDNATAERWYKRALDADPSMPRAQLAYADLFFLREQYANALGYYEKVVAALPNHFAALIQSGLCAQRLAKPDAAIDFFNRAAAIRPDSWMPPYNIACVHAQQNRLDQAIASIEKTAPLVPDDVNLIDYIRNDSDLAPLRNDPRWPALAAKLLSSK
ncbi:MAG: sulfatase-like hydrolase/transferase [Candidatus Hydrogenedentes bacterium]|nr:sulfatase-like hydrolase/transferase [Candidatus Hydrogenedentota bacterium]